MTSYNNKAITYNANGGVASYDGWNYNWNNKGKLASITTKSNARALKPTLSPSKTYSFTYNALGQRITSNYSYFWVDNGLTPIVQGEVTNYSKTFYYDHSGRLISETISKTLHGVGNESESIVFLYDESSIIGMVRTASGVTNAYYFQRNLLGDVIAIYDTNGTKIVEYAYDAWGNCTIKGTTTNYVVAHANPIRYRGYYYDEDTKLYYLNARYYSPEFRRFISPDDTYYLDPESVNGLNLYAYCNNDPVNYADPSGHFPILSVILGLTAIVGLGITVGGVATDNNLLTAIGLTMVAIPSLIAGGLAIWGATGALSTGVGIGTMAAGGFTGVFAGAEYQEAFTGQNFILDSGIVSEGWYNSLMLTTAGIATLGTIASAVTYSFKIKAITEIGKIKGSDFPGIKFVQTNKGRELYRSLEFHYGHMHKGHKLHWQLNKWSKSGSALKGGTAWWTIWFKRIP